MDSQTSPNLSQEKLIHSSLKRGTVHKLLGLSVGLISLECGYHEAHQSSLEILNDVCCEYLKKIAISLRAAHDTAAWRDESDFVDDLERVFHQMNVPSSANLHQFICKLEAIKRHKLDMNQNHNDGNKTIQ